MRLRNARAGLLVAFIVLVAIAGAAAAGLLRRGQRAMPAASGEAPAAIALRADSAAGLDAIAVAAAREGYTVAARIDAPLPSLRLVPPAGTDVARAVARWKGFPGVAYAEPAYPVRRMDAPTDPLWPRQSAYLGVERAPQAWDIEKGSAKVLVAVVDTGVDLSQPDLQGRIWTNPREVPNNGIDDDGDGCIDDVHGCAFDTDPLPGCRTAVNGDVGDDFGHGTFVSGIIAADRNTQGMTGVAPGVTILPVKVLDCQGGGDALQLAEGILYAAQAGAKIINVSLGGDEDSLFLSEAVRIARERYGALVVAASGNGGSTGVAYPARYPGVLAVGAASATDPSRRAPFSNYGPEVGVVAIGEGIVGTVPPASCDVFLPCVNGPYAVGDGTSFAAPQVAGLAALVLSERPGSGPAVIANAIRSTAIAVPSGGLPWAGSGRIDMYAAVTTRPAYRLGVPGVAKEP